MGASTSSQNSRTLALERAALADAMMRECRLCALDCGVDRTHGAAGFCRSDATARAFRERIEWAGESALVPNFVVNLSGCNMRCDFCITGEHSQDGGSGAPVDLAALAARVADAAPRLRSFTIEGGEPTIHLPAALRIASIVPKNLPLVWKTNAYASPAALALLDGVVDVVLADLKFGNDACARRLAGIPRYLDAARENLRWARAHASLIVRHLLMPGHFECCTLPTMDWLAAEMPGTPLTLMGAFLPVFRSGRHAELSRLNRGEEVERAKLEAKRRGLRLSPWSLEGGESPGAAPTDEIWIDRQGRVTLGLVTGELAACLRKISAELAMGA